MQTGWLDDGGRRYFLEGNGAMAKGWTSQNGKWYYLDSSGALSRAGSMTMEPGITAARMA
mgnify:CR=1 FL=1